MTVSGLVGSKFDAGSSGEVLALRYNWSSEPLWCRESRGIDCVDEVDVMVAEGSDGWPSRFPKVLPSLKGEREREKIL